MDKFDTDDSLNEECKGNEIQDTIISEISDLFPSGVPEPVEDDISVTSQSQGEDQCQPNGYSTSGDTHLDISNVQKPSNPEEYMQQQ